MITIDDAYLNRFIDEAIMEDVGDVTIPPWPLFQILLWGKPGCWPRTKALLQVWT